MVSLPLKAEWAELATHKMDWASEQLVRLRRYEWSVFRSVRRSRDRCDTGVIRPVVDKVFPFEGTGDALAYADLVATGMTENGLTQVVPVPCRPKNASEEAR